MEDIYISEADRADLERERYELALERIREIPGESILEEQANTQIRKQIKPVPLRFGNHTQYDPRKCKNHHKHRRRAILSRNIARPQVAKPYKGTVYIDDTLKSAIDAYYEQHGAR